jgi:glycerol-3-phosphate dehydrogenase (NAD(P)+)
MRITKQSRIAVLGAGAWGSTLANMLYLRGYRKIYLWDISPQVIENLRESRTPPKLRNLHLPERIVLTTSLDEALRDASVLVLAIPSHGMRSLCERMQPRLSSLRKARFVICCKGLEEKTLLTPSGVMLDSLGRGVRSRICVLSGPSHAEEVSRSVPTTVVASAFNQPVAEEIQRLFNSQFFRVYTQSDVLGVELGGALKNVIAIAAGICDGLRLGDNPKAALLTRGLAEIIRLGTALGAHAVTFSGLTGVGDLIVTATSHYSRNRNFGELIARGLSRTQAERRIGMVVEGIRTTRCARKLSQQLNVSAPISREVYSVLFRGKDPRDALRSLMQRKPKPEIYS